MKEQFKSFYNDVIKKPSFWGPLLIFIIAAYGFSMFNRSISTDDLWSILKTEDNTIQGGRWGMSLWSNLLGFYTYSPFIDEFVTVFFSVMSAVGISFLLYLRGKAKDVLGYTFLASILVTFPLIVEIYNYNNANFFTTGGLFFGTLALIVWETSWNTWTKYLVAGLILILPAASYEASVFSYLTLFCIMVYYRFVVIEDERPTIKSIYLLTLHAVLPLVLAAVVKFAVPIVYNSIFQTEFTSFGATEIGWTKIGFLGSILNILSSNISSYIVKSLIYFPITEFFFSALFFLSFTLWRCVKSKSFFPILWGGIVIISIFSLSIIQGVGLPYRTASGISVFVAFVVFLFYHLLRSQHKLIRFGVVVFLFALCWHQSAFIHRIQSLNNQRAENEAAAIHHIGLRLVSDYGQKPIVFVNGYYAGEWNLDQQSVDINSWNGKLYKFLSDNYGTPFQPGEKRRIMETNGYPYLSTHEILTPKMIFKYFGYDLNILTDPNIVAQAVSIAKEQQMQPYQIYDNGPYVIVKLNDINYYGE